MQTEALRSMAQRRARELVLDVTGVPVIDTQVARGLMDVVQSVHLMGAKVTLVGIRPEVAQTIVGLGLNLPVRTFSNLQSALGKRAG